MPPAQPPAPAPLVLVCALALAGCTLNVTDNTWSITVTRTVEPERVPEREIQSP